MERIGPGSAVVSNRTNSLFFAGDLGQRISQQPFSWLELGVDIRGLSQNLAVNYRTSHQIRIQSDRLLATEMSDLDGNLYDRSSKVRGAKKDHSTAKVIFGVSEGYTRPDAQAPAITPIYATLRSLFCSES